MCYIQLSLLGCAGYVVIGNTLTEPQVGPVLFGEESSRCWYTPMYFHPVWATRRAIAQARAMFGAVATAFPADQAEQSIAAMGEAEAAESAQEVAVIESKPDEAEQMPPATEQMPAESYQPTFTVSTKKKNAGQLMFDFG